MQTWYKMLRIERKNQRLVKRYEEALNANYNHKIRALSAFIILEDKEFYHLKCARGIAIAYYRGGIKEVHREYEELCDYQLNWEIKIEKMILRYEKDFPPHIRRK